MSDFNEWLKQQLNKPVPGYFDYNGNSSRAVITRGKYGQFKYDLKNLIPFIYREIKYSWAGMDTPVGLILNIILLPIALPIMVFSRPYFSYKRALSDYKTEYEQYKLKQLESEVNK